MDDKTATACIQKLCDIKSDVYLYNKVYQSECCVKLEKYGKRKKNVDYIFFLCILLALLATLACNIQNILERTCNKPTKS